MGEEDRTGGTSLTVGTPSPEQIGDLRRRIGAAIARLRPRWLAADQEDLVQVTLIRVLAATRRAGERGVNASYVLRTAHTVLLDELSLAHRRREVLSDPAGFEFTPSPAGVDPHHARAWKELGEAVGHCLSALASPRRRAVTLHLLGYAPAESARLCGWNAKRASNLVRRGLVDLRTCLTNRGFHP